MSYWSLSAYRAGDRHGGLPDGRGNVMKEMDKRRTKAGASGSLDPFRLCRRRFQVFLNRSASDPAQNRINSVSLLPLPLPWKRIIRVTSLQRLG